MFITTYHNQIILKGNCCNPDVIFRVYHSFISVRSQSVSMTLLMIFKSSHGMALVPFNGIFQGNQLNLFEKNSALTDFWHSHAALCFYDISH